MIRVPSRRDRTSPARASTCRCCDVLATLCEISPANSSTDRSPWASTSTISARRPLPSACATDANASNNAALACPLAIDLSSYHLNTCKSRLRKRRSSWRVRTDATGAASGEGSGDVKTLIVLNDPAYGSERSYNGLRLAHALAKRDGEQVRVFLLADAVTCALAGQQTPNG